MLTSTDRQAVSSIERGVETGTEPWQLNQRARHQTVIAAPLPDVFKGDVLGTDNPLNQVRRFATRWRVGLGRGRWGEGLWA